MPTFDQLLAHAQKRLKTEPAQADYWNGYVAGLRLGHQGLEIGTEGARG